MRHPISACRTLPTLCILPDSLTDSFLPTERIKSRPSDPLLEHLTNTAPWRCLGLGDISASFIAVIQNNLCRESNLFISNTRSIFASSEYSEDLFTGMEWGGEFED